MMSSIAVRTLRRAALLVVTAGVLSAPVHAQFYQNSTGLANAAKTISFSEHVFPDGTIITNQFAGEGITFLAGIHYNAVGPMTSFVGISGDYLANFNGFPQSPFSIYFTNPQTRAGFSAATNPGFSTFEALFHGTVVASATNVATTFTDPNAFYGFTGVTFDEIRFTVGGGNDSALFDNVQYGLAPEPGTFVLLGAFLIPGAALLRRRKLK